MSYLAALFLYAAIFAVILTLCARGDRADQKRVEASVPIIAAAVDRLSRVPAEDTPLDFDKFIEAVIQVEGWRGRPGPAGEQGIWQWTEDTWGDYSERPYVWAALSTPQALEEQRATARRQLEHRLQQFEAVGVHPTITALALSISCGFDGSRRPEVPSRKLDAAARVANLYWTAVENAEL